MEIHEYLNFNLVAGNCLPGTRKVITGEIGKRQTKLLISSSNNAIIKTVSFRLRMLLLAVKIINR